MKSMTPQSLAKLISDAGMTPASLSKEIGRGQDYVRDFIVGRKSSLKAEDWQRIVERLGVATESSASGQIIDLDQVAEGMPVLGTAQAGAWLEAIVRDRVEERIPVNRDPRYPFAEQYALRVSGNSMDQIIPDGSYVICVNFDQSGLPLRPGLIVHVEQTKHDLSEVTIKEIALENGRLVLIPRSSDPDFKPIRWSENEAVEIKVRGVVVGQFSRF